MVIEAFLDLFLHIECLWSNVFPLISIEAYFWGILSRTWILAEGLYFGKIQNYYKIYNQS